MVPNTGSMGEIATVIALQTIQLRGAEALCSKVIAMVASRVQQQQLMFVRGGFSV